MTDKPLGQILKDLPNEKKKEIMDKLSPEEIEEIVYDSWRTVWARPSQIIEDSWPEPIVLLMSGRGYFI